MPDHDKPSNQEEEYFAREDLEKKRKLALKQKDELAAQERERLKQLHWMRCPKCGLELQMVKEGSVEVDTCFNCKGVWLDEGELDQLRRQPEAGPGSRAVDAILNIFGRK
jgi:uncharacterized protein